ncbi:MAG: hypothetical protein IJL06_05740 [Kiritimatiellae bacterium]|nr:hypothetical protein [Kiritimatiellia bacterium]
MNDPAATASRFPLLPDREMTLGEILATGFRAFFGMLPKMLLGFLLIYGALNLIVALVPFEDLFPTMDELRVARLETKFAQTLDRFFGCVAVVAAVLASGHVLAGLPVSPRHAFRGAVSRWWPMIWTGLLAGLVLIGLTLLLIVPGIIWGIYYSFLVPVVAFGLSGTEALAESKRLVKGNWWRTLGCVFVIGLVGAALMLPGILFDWIYAVFLSPSESWEPTLLDEIVDYLTSVYTDVAYLFVPVATTVFFLNRRSVVDGTAS